MTMQFYRLGDATRPTGVFRERAEDGGLYLERYDPATRGWRDDHAGLVGYVFNGEAGAEPVTTEEAQRLIEALDKPPPSAGHLPGVESAEVALLRAPLTSQRGALLYARRQCPLH